MFISLGGVYYEGGGRLERFLSPVCPARQDKPEKKGYGFCRMSRMLCMCMSCRAGPRRRRRAAAARGRRPTFRHILPFRPFRPILWNRYLPPDPANAAEHSPKSISEGGRIWRVHPVSITRFPLSRFSPGAGLLRNPFVCTISAKIFQGLGPKRRKSCNGDRVY